MHPSANGSVVQWLRSKGRRTAHTVWVLVNFSHAPHYFSFFVIMQKTKFAYTRLAISAKPSLSWPWFCIRWRRSFVREHVVSVTWWCTRSTNKSGLIRSLNSWSPTCQRATEPRSWGHSKYKRRVLLLKNLNRFSVFFFWKLYKEHVNRLRITQIEYEIPKTALYKMMKDCSAVHKKTSLRP